MDLEMVIAHSTRSDFNGYIIYNFFDSILIYSVNLLHDNCFFIIKAHINWFFIYAEFKT